MQTVKDLARHLTGNRECIKNIQLYFPDETGPFGSNSEAHLSMVMHPMKQKANFPKDLKSPIPIQKSFGEVKKKRRITSNNDSHKET